LRELLQLISCLLHDKTVQAL